MKKKIIISLTCIVISANLSYSQSNQWMIFNTSNSSIPTNNVSEVTIDQENNIWFVAPWYLPSDTGLGIIKFDFNSFEIINETSDGINLTYTSRLVSDLESRIWFFGLSSNNYFGAFWGYKNGDWIYYTPENSPMPNLGFNSVTVDSNNNKWMLFPNDFGNDYIARLENNSIWTLWNDGQYSILQSPYTLKLTAVDSANNLWIGGNTGLVKFDGVTQTHYQTPLGLYPQQICIDKQENIWSIGGGSWDHLVKFKDGIYTDFPSIKGQNCAIDNSNNLWIGSNDELLKYDGMTWTTINSSNSSLPPNDGISYIITDNWGNLVLGLISINNQPNTGGLVIYNPEGIIIPVELISFALEQLNNSVIIKWSTATELNNSGFELFRNEKLLSFIEGNGTTTEQQSYEYIDRPLEVGVYKYNLYQIDYDGTKNKIATQNIKFSIEPLAYILKQNYPNPFNPSTTINYSIKKNGLVTLKVYSILGKEVATLVNENQEAGNYSIKFNASKLPSGIYFYSLKSGGFSSTKKLILLK